MNVLSIGGSDPSAGAGIQGDIKTFTKLGVYGLTIVTAITSQSSSDFFKIETVSPSIIKSQIRSILSDFKVDCIKIGMVYDKKTIKEIYHELRNLKIPIILDPIFESTTGGVLLKKDAFPDFKKYLIPLAFVITPNIPESERITGKKIRFVEDMKIAAREIFSMGAKNVVIKGGHASTKSVTDLLFTDGRFYTFSEKKIPRESHGGGCVFSASLSAEIAKGVGLQEAVRFAQKTSFESIKNAIKIGRGLHMTNQRKRTIVEEKISDAINQLISLKNFYMYVPEVQSNFVFSKIRPDSVSDVAGIEGRLVKTGKSVSLAGTIKFGGSRHVASALLEISKRFPDTRSALNIKYNPGTVEKALRENLLVSSYDRRQESRKSRNIEGSTIPWGINSAVKNLKFPPDIIYHKGDIGKEPIIIIFGTDPKNVLTKLVKIMR